MSGGLRIIAGEWRGRKLVTPAGQATRPTASRVRETLFSMLTSRLGGFTDRRVADIFAGSGALGLEALSRGAAHCTFVERDRSALDALSANCRALSATDRTTLLAMPAASARTTTAVDIALFDPPYAEPDINTLLEQLHAHGWFAPAAWISIETGHDQSPAPAGFTVDTVRDVGKARLTLLKAPA